MKILNITTVFLVIFALADSAYAASKYYRYKDMDGNLIISNSIDAESANLGYEILDRKGKLIKKVDPAPTNEQQKAVVDEKKRQAEQKDFDISLMRKYSFVTDIEAEKKRKLVELQATLSIVKGNLTGIRAELEGLYASAAAIEREGKPIPNDLKKKITDVEAVVISTEDLYKIREEDIKKTSDDYDRAITRFQEIQALRGR